MSLFSSLLQRASSLASAIDQLLLSMIALGVLFVLLVLIVTFLPGKTRTEKTSTKNEGRFQLWAGLIAGAVLVALFAWSTALYTQAAKVPADATDVTVLAQRWLWKFQHYPDGKREINELHVPVDQPIKLTMISRDAIHSLAIPALGVHQDILPEQFTTIWFIANEPGEYPFYSAEYNGTGYVDMVGRVVVEEREAFDKWLGGEGELDGAALFSSLGCAACHIDAGGGIGPSMLGLYGSQATLDNGETVTADDDYLREAILDPNAAVVQNYAAVMPSFEGQLSDAQLQALIDYIKSLAGEAAPAHEAPTEGATATAGGSEGVSFPDTYSKLGCVGCHGQQGEGLVGPILAGLNPDYVKTTIREGVITAGMPPFPTATLSDDDLDELAQVISSLTLADTGIELSPDVIDALSQAREALAANDMATVATYIKAAQDAATSASPGVKITLKFLLEKAEAGETDYVQTRLDALIGNS